MDAAEVGGREVSQTERQAREAQAEPSRPMRWGTVDAGPIAAFVAVAYLVTNQLWASPTSVTPSENGTDQTFFEMMLWHAVRIFTHGENPFLTPALNAPIGVNVMANTGMLGIAVPFAPLTAWLGPAPVYVLIIMLGLAGTATSWYYVISRHFVGSRFAAVAGALVCGFGPGIVTHANGHPNIVSQFVIPLILWRALALRQSTRTVRDGLILGGLVAYQAFINEELLFLTVLGGAVFVVIYSAFRPSEAARAARGMAQGLCVGALFAAVILAAPLWYQFNGPGHFNGLPSWMQDAYRLPVDSYVHTPTLSFFGDEKINKHLATGTEQNSFLGWPVLIAAFASTVCLWRRSVAVRALAILSLIFAWASFGNMVMGSTLPGRVRQWRLFPLWKIFNELPLFNSVLPSRLALVVLPAVGLLIAFGAGALWRTLSRAWDELRPIQAAAGAIAVVALIGAVSTIMPTSVKTQSRGPVPRFFTSGDWRAYVPPGYTVLPADPANTIGSMRWSVVGNLDFGVPGGYFLGPDQNGNGQFGPAYRETMVVLWDVANGTWHLDNNTTYWQAQAQSDLAYWHTAIIVMPVSTPNEAELKQTVTTLVGTPGRQVDDVWLWDVRSLTDR